MDPITIALIVTASVVAYGTGYGATMATLQRHLEWDGDDASIASFVWPLVLPGCLGYLLVRQLGTRRALPPARVIDREEEQR